MSKETRRQLFKEPLPDKPNEKWFLVGELSYNRGDLGGRRGYRVHVSPEGEGVGGLGHTTRIIPLGLGGGFFLCGANRFNAKELARLVVPADQLEALKQKVLTDYLAEQERSKTARAEWEASKSTGVGQ